MTEEMKKEFALRITSANKSELIVVLYEMTLQYLAEMIEAIETKNYRRVGMTANCVRNCISELESSLNSEFEISANLMSIYKYCEVRISRAQGALDAQAVKNVSGLIEQLRNAWEKVAANDDSAPVMDNTEEVYSGLTYGKNASRNNGTLDLRSRGYYV